MSYFALLVVLPLSVGLCAFAFRLSMRFGDTVFHDVERTYVDFMVWWHLRRKGRP